MNSEVTSNTTQNLGVSYSLNSVSVCESSVASRDPSKATSTSLMVSRFGTATTALGGPVAIFLNGLMLVAFCKNSSLRTKANILILALTVADFMKSAAMPLKLTKEALYQKGIKSNCYIDILLENLGLHVVTGLILCALNCERFIGVRFPIWHRVHVTEARLFKTAIACYVSGITIVLLTTLDITGMFPLILSTTVITTLTIVFVVLIWRAIRKRNRTFMNNKDTEKAKVPENNNEIQDTEESGKQEKDEAKNLQKILAKDCTEKRSSSKEAIHAQDKLENTCQKRKDEIEVLKDLENGRWNEGQDEPNSKSKQILKHVFHKNAKPPFEYIFTKKEERDEKEKYTIEKVLIVDLEKEDDDQNKVVPMEKNISPQLVDKKGKCPASNSKTPANSSQQHQDKYFSEASKKQVRINHATENDQFKNFRHQEFTDLDLETTLAIKCSKKKENLNPERNYASSVHSSTAKQSHRKVDIHVKEIENNESIETQVQDLTEQSSNIGEHLNVQQNELSDPKSIKIQRVTAIQGNRNLVSSAERKAAKIATYLVLCILITRIIPLAIIALSITSTSIAASLIDKFVFLTSVINPLIYGCMNTNIRKACLKLICRE